MSERDGAPRDETRLWSSPDLDGLELYRARHSDHRYPPHAPDTYCICLNTRGSGRWRCRGADYRPRPGQFFVLNPEEVSEGETAGHGYSIRSLYVPAPLFAELLGRDRRDLPWFRSTLFDDEAIARSLAAAHLFSERHGTTLEASERLWGALQFLGMRHADRAPRERRRRAEARVKRAVDYLEAHYDRRVELGELARVTGLSRDHVTRAFRAEMGIAPFAYLDGIRVRHARNLLRRGRSIQDAALLVGFYDQSHLTNRFKRLFGVTPGRYVQEVVAPRDHRGRRPAT